MSYGLTGPRWLGRDVLLTRDSCEILKRLDLQHQKRLIDAHWLEQMESMPHVSIGMGTQQ